uniref:putative reverse transcriptase/maturase n=1 Tax=Stylonema alsidii TaxID=35155 RepID=UPI001FCD3FD9|nr:putative reverse transcriptase/maturase [Stylonema alsidii]UNJ15260.1 putative reverse transcriptase/maturase [Stylonema alsidii]
MNKMKITSYLFNEKQIYFYIQKYQKKIYSASLLNEKNRVQFLQNKLIQSKLFGLWVVHLIEKEHRQTLSPCEKKEILFQLKNWNYTETLNHNLIQKAQILLLNLILTPEWDAKLHDSLNSQISSTSQSIQNIKRNYSNKNFSYFIEINLYKYLNPLKYPEIIDELDNSYYIKLYIYNLMQSNVLHQFQNLITDQYFIIENFHSKNLQLINLFIKILWNKFLKVVSNYQLAQKKLLYKICDSNPICQFICNNNFFIIFSSSYHHIQNINKLLLFWLKEKHIHIPTKFFSIQYKSKNFILMYHSFYQTQKKTLSIKPCNFAQIHLCNIIKIIIKRLQNASSKIFIYRLSIIIKMWKQYFKSCNCKKTFYKLDEQIFQKVKKWAYRRHPNWSTEKIKNKYFNRIYGLKYYDRIYSGNWILSLNTNNNNLFILEKLRWKNHYLDLKPNTSLYSFNYLYQYGIQA